MYKMRLPYQDPYRRPACDHCNLGTPYQNHSCPDYNNTSRCMPDFFSCNPYPCHNNYDHLMDFGPNPFVINIAEATKQNNTFRTALWTGTHLQLTLMSIDAGDSIGLEMHPDVDQFLRIEDGQGIVKMGHSQDRLDYEEEVRDNYIIMIPAGTWHNVINTGNHPLKMYSIYAPPNHPHGTVHLTKADAEAAEGDH